MPGGTLNLRLKGCAEEGVSTQGTQPLEPLTCTSRQFTLSNQQDGDKVLSAFHIVKPLIQAFLLQIVCCLSEIVRLSDSGIKS